MKQIKTIFSFFFIILGVCIITASKLAEEVVPNNGFYNIDLTFNYWVGALSIVGGSIYIIVTSTFMVNSLAEIKARNREFEEKNYLNNN